MSKKLSPGKRWKAHCLDDRHDPFPEMAQLLGLIPATKRMMIKMDKDPNRPYQFILPGDDLNTQVGTVEGCQPIRISSATRGVSKSHMNKRRTLVEDDTGEMDENRCVIPAKSFRDFPQIWEAKTCCGTLARAIQTSATTKPEIVAMGGGANCPAQPFV